MYAFVVRRLVRRRLAELSRGTPDKVIAKFHRGSVFTLIGDHALGGERRGRSAVAEWFTQMFGVFPGIVIEPVHIAVAGWPWRTSVTTQFVVRAALAGGRPYRNEGVQIIRMRWGRVLEERIYEDTVLLRDALDHVGRQREMAGS
jgi:ketosteroid isomerase-like protein